MVGCSGCGRAWNECSCGCPHGSTYGEHRCDNELGRAKEALTAVWKRDVAEALALVGLQPRGEDG